MEVVTEIVEGGSIWKVGRRAGKRAAGKRQKSCSEIGDFQITEASEANSLVKKSKKLRKSRKSSVVETICTDWESTRADLSFTILRLKKTSKLGKRRRSQNANLREFKCYPQHSIFKSELIDRIKLPAFKG